MAATTIDLYDTLLARYPVAYESRFVSTPLGRTHVLLSGAEDAPPLLLIHGAGMNGLVWMNQISAFSAQFRVAAIDLPGQAGRSDVRRLPLLGTGTAEWLCAVLDGLNFAQTNIVGGSLGGWVSLRFAAAFPRRVAKLALLAPGGIIRVNWPALLPFAPALLSRNTAQTAAFIQKMAYHPIAPDVLEVLARIVNQQLFRTAVAPTVLSDTELQRIAAPTLIILGADDQVFLTPSLAPRAACLPHAKIVTLDSCGHLIPHDQPDATMRALMAFLS